MKILRFAGIDIGTNAVRLLVINIMDYGSKQEKSKASLIRIPLRLGSEVFTSGKISKSKGKQLIKTMKAFRQIMEVYNVVSYRACATSAMREATNGIKVIKEIKEKAGIKIELISGKEAAQILYTTGEKNIVNENEYYLSADLGGGSLELTLFSNNKIIKSHSFKIGTIRQLYEKVDTEEYLYFKEWLTELVSLHGKPKIIGSGGNINKISRIAQIKRNECLKREHILEIFNLLEPLSLPERMKTYNMNPDRADVIVPAANVYIEIMNITGADEIIVPKVGLADGIINQLFEEYKLNNK